MTQIGNNVKIVTHDTNVNIFWSSFKCISMEEVSVKSLWVLQSVEVLCFVFFSESACELQGQRPEGRCGSWHSSERQPNPCACLPGRSPLWQGGREGACAQTQLGLPGQRNLPPGAWASSSGAPLHTQAAAVPPRRGAWTLNEGSWETRRMVPGGQWERNSADSSCRKRFLSVLEGALSEAPSYLTERKESRVCRPEHVWGLHSCGPPETKT